MSETAKPKPPRKQAVRPADPLAPGCCWVEVYHSFFAGWVQCNVKRRWSCLTCRAHAKHEEACRAFRDANRPRPRGAA